MINNRYKNEIHQLIVREGLNTDLFALVDREGPLGKWHTALDLKDSPLSFEIHNKKNSFDLFYVIFLRYIPGYPATQPLTHENPNFEFVKDLLLEWLNNHVKRYLENVNVPNLWEINFSDIVSNYKKEDANKLASVEHKKVVTERLGEVEKLLASNNKLMLVNAGMEILFEEIQELKAKIDNPNITYKDIKITVLGTVVSWVAEKIIDFPVGAAIAEFLINGKKIIFNFFNR